MKKLDSEPLATNESSPSRRLSRLESLLRSEVGKIIEREIEVPANTLLTITEVKVLPDLSQARIGVSVLPIDKSDLVFKILIKATPELQRQINERLHLYRVPKLSFYLDDSLAEANKIESLLDSLKLE